MKGKFKKEVIGKRSVYTINEVDGGFLSSTSYYIYKDGKYWDLRKSLADAVNICQ